MSVNSMVFLAAFLCVVITLTALVGGLWWLLESWRYKDEDLK